MDKYKQYTGIMYLPGRRDCFGLARQFYWNEHGLYIKNYARPEDFAFKMRNDDTGIEESVLDLFSHCFPESGFIPQNGNWRSLEVGDGLLFNVGNSTVVNHCGIYLGNNAFLHHLYGKVSQIEALSDFWRSACIQKLRHPRVYKERPKPEPLDFMEIINPHVRRRLLRAKEEMDARAGEVRADT